MAFGRSNSLSLKTGATNSLLYVHTPSSIAAAPAPAPAPASHPLLPQCRAAPSPPGRRVTPAGKTLRGTAAPRESLSLRRCPLLLRWQETPPPPAAASLPVLRPPPCPSSRSQRHHSRRRRRERRCRCRCRCRGKTLAASIRIRGQI